MNLEYRVPSLIPGEELIIPEEHRLPPRDDGFLSSSPWQLMGYDYELTLKGNPITDGNDKYYRNKMEYSLFWSHEDEKIHLAFHLRRSYRKFPIKNSVLERPEIFARAKEIVDDLNARGEEARKYQSILLRCNQKGQVEGGLFEKGQPHPTFNNLTDTILGHEYSYSPNGFFQINLPVYEMALKEIAKHIQTDKVLDLYAGVGTIGLSVARDHQLTLVETNPAAYAELEKNCLGQVNEGSFSGLAEATAERERANPVTTSPWDEEGRRPTGVSDATRGRALRNTPRAVLSNSEDALDFITPDTTVILDPPRAGCHPKLLEKLLQELPPTIIYLSCNPSTQARDLKILAKKYQATLTQPYNFFPRTPHLENLVVLQPKRV